MNKQTFGAKLGKQLVANFYSRWMNMVEEELTVIGITGVSDQYEFALIETTMGMKAMFAVSGLRKHTFIDGRIVYAGNFKEINGVIYAIGEHEPHEIAGL
jgi:hypothetical protein